uniref:AI-2E family transporter n=1 Tax=Geoglobus ahangari TaxID=113653 RepID=A0A7C3YCH4_9EURY
MEKLKLAVIIAVFILFLYLISPLLDGVVMGIAFAYVAKPIHEKLRIRLREPFSAFISTTIIAIPIFFFFFYGIFQGITQLVFILSNYDIVDLLNKYIGTSKLVSTLINQAITFISNKIGDLAVKITTRFIFFIMNFAISIVVCFYIIADGKRVAEKAINLFKSEELKTFFIEIDKTLTGLWFGNFIAALLIGLASIPYFLIFEVPYASLLSGLMFLAALIPVFAEWMVILPVAFYLYFVDPIKALWFTVIGAVFFYIIPELILRPQFVGYTSKIHPLLLLLSFIGGGIVAGVTGFFLTPMLAATLSAVYNHFVKYTQTEL